MLPAAGLTVVVLALAVPAGVLVLAEVMIRRAGGGEESGADGSEGGQQPEQPAQAEPEHPRRRPGLSSVNRDVGRVATEAAVAKSANVASVLKRLVETRPEVNLQLEDRRGVDLLKPLWACLAAATRLPPSNSETSYLTTMGS